MIVNQPAPRSTPRGFRPAVILGWAVLACLLVVTLLGFLLRTRNQLPELTPERLVEAYARRQRARPANYTMDLRLAGTLPGDVHVQVQNGKVIVFDRDGHTPRQRRTWDVWSVDGQFDTLYDELNLATDPVAVMQAPQGTQLLLRATFDRQWGYPVRYHRLVLGEAPEVYWEVIRFEVDP